ncbi:MAG TPA: nuclear transport factor 2 family protein [Pyrinomonadaceae bacterium]|nr:nuclear transport factor 2 family protein [Pyrinomonadaceae bacterium]
MPRIIIHLLVSLATFLIGTAITAPWSSTARHEAHSYTSAEREILSLERRYLDAHVQRDTATLDSILADDFTIMHRYGRVGDKAERLALVENPDFTFLSVDTSDVDVTINGDEGIVTGRAVVTGRYEDREFRSPLYRFTRRYEKRQGRWQIVSVQFSRNR